MPRPVKQLSSAHVAKLVKNEAHAAQAERAAKREEKKAARAAAKEHAAVMKANDAVIANAQAEQHAAEEATEALKAQRVDFDALIEAGSLPADTAFEAYLASQGFNPDGTPLKSHAAKTPYTGPMVALKTARKSYVKAANGILCNGSPLALLCGQYKREVVVKALIEALGLPGNPYLALNPGQQSMNLRNKARHAISEGRLSLAHVEACLKAAAE